MSFDSDLSKNQRRRRFLIDRPLQLRLIKSLASVGAGQLLLALGGLYLAGRGHPVLAAAAVLVIGGITTLVAAVYLSHQVAGPLQRVQRGLERASQGDYDFQIQLRRDDFLADFPAPLNHLLRSLKEKEQSEVRTLRSIEESIHESMRARLLLRQLRERKEERLKLASAEPERTLTVH